MATKKPEKRAAPKSSKPRERKSLPLKTRLLVLTEAGYRCAVPSCRNILALDLHHIWEVSAGGTNEPSNLIALCPMCHNLYHRGTIHEDAIYAYKAMLVAITGAFDVKAIDQLLFLELCDKDFLVVSGDGLLHFGRLVAAGLAEMEQKTNNNFQVVTYSVWLSEKGRQLIAAWRQGDRTRLTEVMGGIIPGGSLNDQGTSGSP